MPEDITPKNPPTVQELIDQLSQYPPDWVVTFGGVLDFYRLKQRDVNVVDVEFSQTVSRDSQTGQWFITP